MIAYLISLWPAPRPHRGEYRNTVRSIDVVRLARGMDLELHVRGDLMPKHNPDFALNRLLNNYCGNPANLFNGLTGSLPIHDEQRELEKQAS